MGEFEKSHLVTSHTAPEKGYKKLILWQKADELAYQVYLASKSFPRHEIFGITSQLRRSALSVPTNIAEGTGRQNKNEIKQFANIALGSLAETEYLLEFCFRLKYLDTQSFQQIEMLRKDVGRLLWKFYLSFS